MSIVIRIPHNEGVLLACDGLVASRNIFTKYDCQKIQYFSTANEESGAMSGNLTGPICYYAGVGTLSQINFVGNELKNFFFSNTCSTVGFSPLKPVQDAVIDEHSFAKELLRIKKEVPDNWSDFELFFGFTENNNGDRLVKDFFIYNEGFADLEQRRLGEGIRVSGFGAKEIPAVARNMVNSPKWCSVMSHEEAISFIKYLVSFAVKYFEDSLGGYLHIVDFIDYNSKIKPHNRNSPQIEHYTTMIPNKDWEPLDIQWERIDPNPTIFM